MAFNILVSCDGRGKLCLSDLIAVLFSFRIRLFQYSFRQGLGTWWRCFVTLEVDLDVEIDFINVSNHWINLSLLNVLNFSLS